MPNFQRTAQKHALQIETFDAMFSACNDPLQFFSLELIRKATVPTLLAGLVWVLPLCAIASPASLTSAASSLNTTLTCDDIPNLDFSRENSYGPDSVNADGEGLSYWDFEDDNRVYYTGPSMDFQRLSTLSLLSKTGPLQPSNPCVGGGNCSYAVSFDGPAYKCEEQPDFDSNIPMKKGNLAPDGNYTYYGYSSTSEEIGGRPAEWSNATDDKIGVFYDEPALWIGYVINTTEPFNSSESSLWHHKLDPKVMKCTLYNATYSYTLSFMNGVMFVNNSKTNFISPLLEEGASVSPNASNYKAFAGFHAAGFLFCKTMYNAINQSGESGWSETYSDISQTTLVDADTSLTVPNFPSAVETKFADLVLSIMSDDIMHSKIHISVPCTMANIVLVWNYAPLWLWLSYGAALLTTLVAVAVGAAAISRNGYAVDTNFSTFLATTRSKDLDDIAE
ncbi:MAG: hypothetical protein M1830_006219, partial [Pleopsidium flavum]